MEITLCARYFEKRRAKILPSRDIVSDALSILASIYNARTFNIFYDLILFSSNKSRWKKKNKKKTKKPNNCEKQVRLMIDLHVNIILMQYDAIRA